MPEFTAVLECDMFTYEVKAYIDEMGVNVMDVYFGEDSLNRNQINHFIRVYGSADLDDEILNQYEEYCKEQEADKMVEAWEINNLYRRFA